MAKGEALRDRTAAAIIDSAATLLAAHGDASIDDIAAAAGVGRATLYRYFANRDELLKALAVAGVTELAAGIQQAQLTSIPVEEALARLTRAILTAGSKYIALNRDGGRHSEAYPNLEADVIAPIRDLFRRGLADGSLRKGLTPDALMTLYTGLVRGALEPGSGWRVGIDERVAAVTTVFLRGVHAP